MKTLVQQGSFIKVRQTVIYVRELKSSSVTAKCFIWFLSLPLFHILLLYHITTTTNNNNQTTHYNNVTLRFSGGGFLFCLCFYRMSDKGGSDFTEEDLKSFEMKLVIINK
jgi:hypothetical protein